MSLRVGSDLLSETPEETAAIERLQAELSDAMARAVLLSVDETSPEFLAANERFEALLSEWNALAGGPAESST